MKLLLSAAVAALTIAGAAAAQTNTTAPAGSACPALAAPPSLPDGANANYEQMEQANEAHRAWATANRASLECRRAEVEAARARYEALRTEFNAGAEQLNAVQTGWEAEVTEFNERNPRSRTR
jgi:hypothetical protein